MKLLLKFAGILLLVAFVCSLFWNPEPFLFTLNDSETGYILEKYYNNSSEAQSKVVIPDSYQGVPVVEIGSGAFVGNEDLTAVVIPEGVKAIGGNAFANCHHLTSITFPSSLREIKESAFSDCTALSKIVIPQAVNIGRSAFVGCGSLYMVSIGSDEDKATFKVDYAAFERCSNLKTVTLGSGCVSIGELAFAQCVSLEDVYLPNSLNEIDTCAFEHCESLSNIYFDGTTNEWLNVYFAPWWDKDTGYYQDHTNQ